MQLGPVECRHGVQLRWLYNGFRPCGTMNNAISCYGGRGVTVIWGHNNLSDVYTKWNVLLTYEEVHGMIWGLDVYLTSRRGAVYGITGELAASGRNGVTRYQCGCQKGTLILVWLYLAAVYSCGWWLQCFTSTKGAVADICIYVDKCTNYKYIPRFDYTVKIWYVKSDKGFIPRLFQDFDPSITLALIPSGNIWSSYFMFF